MSGKQLVIAAWTVLLLAIGAAASWLYGQRIEPVFNPDRFTSEEQAVYDKIIAKKQAALPKKVGVLDDGTVVYRYPDGKLTSQLPNYVNGGQITLSDMEQRRVAEAQLIAAPWWVPGEKQLSIRDYKSYYALLVFELVLGLFLGLFFGLVFGLVDGLVFGLSFGSFFGSFFGSVFGLVLGLAGWLVFGLAGWLVFGLVFGLVFLTKKVWGQMTSEGDIIAAH